MHCTSCGKLFKTSSLRNHKRNHTKGQFSNTLPDRFLTSKTKFQLVPSSGWLKCSSCTWWRMAQYCAFFKNHLWPSLIYCISGSRFCMVPASRPRWLKVPANFFSCFFVAPSYWPPLSLATPCTTYYRVSQDTGHLKVCPSPKISFIRAAFSKEASVGCSVVKHPVEDLPCVFY